MSFVYALVGLLAIAVTVDVRRISGDSDITVRSSSSSLTFTASDWDDYQEVVVDASEDAVAFDHDVYGAARRCAGARFTRRRRHPRPVAENETPITICPYRR